MSTNNLNGITNDENEEKPMKEGEDELFNLEDDDDEQKQELNEDNQLKCSLFEKDQIQCPTCQQITEVSNVNELIDNFILIHELEEFALKTGSIECRACTSNKLGVAHCSTCSSYLCAKCCQTHQYMKCFEQHHVRRLSQTDHEEQDSTKMCSIHLKNAMKFFCTTCSQTLCDQCLYEHPTPQHGIQKTPLEQIRSDLNDKFNDIDHHRSNALAHLDHQLTSLQHDYDQTKTQIDLSHTQYQQALNQVYKECLSSLNHLQRDEEMRLIDKLETIQKGSQSFDDSRTIFQRCLDKCSLNELIQLKAKLFDSKLNSFQQLFHFETIHNEQQKTDLVTFYPTPIQDFGKATIGRTIISRTTIRRSELVATTIGRYDN